MKTSKKKLEYIKRWAKANPEKKREHQRNWRERHPEKAREKFRKLYEQRQANQRLARHIAIADGGCQVCGQQEGPLHWHHIDPTTKTAKPSTLARAGKWREFLDEIENCIPLCPTCHGVLHWRMENCEDFDNEDCYAAC